MQVIGGVKYAIGPGGDDSHGGARTSVEKIRHSPAIQPLTLRCHTREDLSREHSDVAAIVPCECSSDFVIVSHRISSQQAAVFCYQHCHDLQVIAGAGLRVQ